MLAQPEQIHFQAVIVRLAEFQTCNALHEDQNGAHHRIAGTQHELPCQTMKCCCSDAQLSSAFNSQLNYFWLPQTRVWLFTDKRVLTTLYRILAGGKRVKVGAFQAAQDGDAVIRVAAAQTIPVLHGACSQSMPDEAAFLQLCLDALTR